jgi:hypothetical protein
MMVSYLSTGRLGAVRCVTTDGPVKGAPRTARCFWTPVIRPRDQPRGDRPSQRHPEGRAEISADEAFTRLVEQSQRENIKLRDLAVRFVTHATGRAPST